MATNRPSDTVKPRAKCSSDSAVKILPLTKWRVVVVEIPCSDGTVPVLPFFLSGVILGSAFHGLCRNTGADEAEEIFRVAGFCDQIDVFVVFGIPGSGFDVPKRREVGDRESY